jgi:hypothetical protein
MQWLSETFRSVWVGRCQQSAAKWGPTQRETGGRVEGPQLASLPLAARHIEGEDHGDRAAQTTALDGARIAHQLGLSAATFGRVLRRLGLNRACDLEPRLPPNRYEHLAPGDLLHLDIKRLVRIQGLRTV